MDFRVLGPLEVYRDGRCLEIRRRRERGLLGLLLLAAGTTVQADRLVSLLWDGDPPVGARRQLSVNVSRLRTQLTGAGDALAADGLGYRLNVDPGTVDAHRFRVAVERARATADPRIQVAVLEEAITMWRGPLLADALTDEASRRVGRGLDELHASALELLCGAWLALGTNDSLVSRLYDLTEQHPAREGLHVLLMRALDASGRTTEALQYYRTLRQRWVDDFGLEPGTAIQETHGQLLRCYGGATAAAPPAPAPPRPPAARPVPRQLPADVAAFTGRDAELGALDGLLPAVRADPGPVVVAAVSGTAGVGKTALAVHWAHRVAGRFADGQLYVNLHGFDPADQVLAPGEAVRGFLAALGVPPERVPPDLDAQAALYRSLLAGRRTLVVLDNARDAAHVRALLPGASSCLALVTSRNQLTPLVAADGAHPLHLDVLSDGESRQLLARRLGPDRVGKEPAAVHRIVTACARLPLALSIAAARARQTSFPLAVLAEELGSADGLLAALDAGDITTQVRAVFSWSYATLQPPVARMFRLLGLHPGPDISACAAASLAARPVVEARAHLTGLTSANLLVEHAPGRYLFHDLLRAYASELTHTHDPPAERTAAMTRLLDHYVHTGGAAVELLDPRLDPSPAPWEPPVAGTRPEPLGDHAQARAWQASEYAVLLAAIRHTAAVGLDHYTCHLAWAVRLFLDRTGRWHDLSAIGDAVRLAGKRMDRPIVEGFALRMSARGQIRLGQFAEGRRDLEQALTILTAAGDRAGMAHTHNDFNQISLLTGAYTEALAHGAQAFELFRSVDHLAGTGVALVGLGYSSARAGRPLAALDYCRQALAFFRQFGDLSAEAQAGHSLGYAHHQAGQYAEAADCYRQALRLLHTHGDRYGSATVLNDLGEAHHAAGDSAAAREAWLAALTIFTELHHPEADAVRAKLERATPGS
jgi:DNA-binding SARP family transcriptional activator/tetratricopeptide (TPR) repeat protein